MARTLLLSLLLLFTAACGRPDFGSAIGEKVSDPGEREPVSPPTQPGGTPPGESCDDDGADCDQASDPTAPTPSLDPSDARQHGDFTFNAYRAVDPDVPNLVISPHTLARSLLIAHAAAPNSAAGAAIDRVVDAYGADFYNEFNSSDQLLENMYDSAHFAMLGAIWVDQGAAVEVDFNDEVIGYTGIPTRRLDFSAPEDARNQINNWYSVSSNGMISDVVNARALDASTAFVITDATWLAIPWAFEGFDPALTRPVLFHGVDDKVIVPMMQGDVTVDYFGDDQLQVVTLPLEGDFSLIALLPLDYTSLDASLDESMLRRVIDESSTQHVTVNFPRFELSSRVALSALAPSLGLDDVFSEDAVLDAFADGTQLHDAYHRTSISFNEAGITTNTGVPATPELDSTTADVRFDRPFFFAIHSARFDRFVILGRVTQI